MKRINLLFLAITIVTLSVFCISSSGWAQSKDTPPLLIAQGVEMQGRPGFPPEGEPEGGEPRMNWKQLGLSEAQKAQMEQKRREFQINTAGIREKLRFAEQDLRAEMIKDPVDRAKIDSLLNDIATMRRQTSEAATQNLLAIKSILTPEQLEKLASRQIRLPMGFEKLQLTPEQRSKIQAILKNSMQKNRETMEKLRELKTDLREILLSSEKVDAEKLKQIQADIADKELALEKGHVEMLLQIKEMLTPEQRETLQKAWPKLQQREEKREQKLPIKRKNQ
jgi:Spy/CpxP family protein refolding chaperone